MKVIVSVFNNLFTDQRVEKVCKTLTEKGGYNIELIGNDWGGSPEMDRPYPFCRLHLQSRILRYAYVEFQWKLYRKLLQAADKNSILLSNDLDTLLPNYMVSRKLDIPLVFDSHEIFTEMPSLNGRFTQKIWRSLESFTVPKLKYMMAASESYADWFQRTYDIARPVVVQNFPESRPSPQDHNNPNSTKVIMYQGVINPFRGLDKIIPAMANIEAELWIAGDGPKKKEYLDLVQALNLQDKVRFLGKLVPDKLREVTRLADAGLSIEENQGLSYFYSMPNKVSDYIQARIPVIVSDFPEMRKVVDNFGVGEKIGNYDELAEKINLVLANGKPFYEGPLNKAAAEFCWEMEEPRILELFEKVTAGNF
ncbi:glycosyltransferase family 4 protein [Kaistella palustris]|uniref:glycosyltransferase family 4 protein n=1 Tax=Kaistella palustris TaxID=493376 RepID=UPI00040630C0|nr:glycosyltransferase family 4 protein [Kaistella palustris]